MGGGKSGEVMSATAIRIHPIGIKLLEIPMKNLRVYDHRVHGKNDQ
jgi:hypothetical protein